MDREAEKEAERIGRRHIAKCYAENVERSIKRNMRWVKDRKDKAELLKVIIGYCNELLKEVVDE